MVGEGQWGVRAILLVGVKSEGDKTGEDKTGDVFVTVVVAPLE